MKNLALLALLLLAAQASAAELKVGVYDNPPLVGRSDSGYEGFYIDILEHIAEKEGWKIVYDYDSFPNLLRKLERGEIDLMTAIAYSEERLRFFNFTNETVIPNWGLIVAKERYDSILQLENLRIAGVTHDVYTESFKKLSKDFELNCEILELEGDYKDVLEAVRLELADAGIVSRIYASLYAEDYGLKITSIIFSPINLKFASKNGELLSIIDRHLAEMKANSNSVYYRSMEKWFGLRYEVVPGWLYPLIAGSAIIICSLLLGNILLGREVRRRTKEREEALRQYEYLWENANDILFIHDLQGNFLETNRKAIELFGYERSWRVKVWDVIVPEYHGVVEEKLKWILETKKPTKPYELLCRTRDGKEVWLETVSHPFIKNGEIVGIHGIARDITERKKLQEQLEKNIMLIAHLTDRIRNMLTAARAYCELREELEDEAAEKAIECIDEVIGLLEDFEKTWAESERLRNLLFGRERSL